MRQPVGEDACPTGKGFRFRSVMGWRGDALRLVRADTAALRPNPNMGRRWEREDTREHIIKFTHAASSNITKNLGRPGRGHARACRSVGFGHSIGKHSAHGQNIGCQKSVTDRCPRENPKIPHFLCKKPPSAVTI